MLSSPDNMLGEKTALVGRLFVGRTAELATLRQALAASLAGHGALLLVSGESGIGKTRLVEELAADTAEQGVLSLWGRCWESGGAPSYWPWVQIIRAYVRRAEPELLAAQMGAGVRRIAQLAPEVGERLALPTAAPPSLDVQPEHARFYLFDAVATLLRNASAAQPLLLLFDDLHAADAPSLLLLRFAARELRESRVLLIGTYRIVEARQRPELVDLAREGEHVALGGLSKEDVARLMNRAWGRPPHEALVSAVHEKTEGNPFFVGEVNSLLMAERISERSSTGIPGIPEGVRVVIRRRLAPLSEECRCMLSIASVFGQEFELVPLQRAFDVALERVLERLGEAREAGVIREISTALGRYGFSHGLVRETLYDDLPPARRTELHYRIAHILEDLYRANVEPHVAELAHHFLEGAPRGAVEKAVGYCRDAAQRAERLLAYEEAAFHYGRALHALQWSPNPDEKLRGDLLIGRGDAEWRTGARTSAQRTFLEAAEIARRLRAPEQFARAALGYGTGLGGFGFTDRADETVLALLEEARTTMGEADSAVKVRVLARLAAELYYTGRVADREALSLEAVETATRLRDPAARLTAFCGRQLALHGPDNLTERIRTAGAVLQLAAEVGEREMAFFGHQFRLGAMLELGDIRAVDAEIEACRRLAAELRQPVYLWQARLFAAMRALLEGRFVDGARLAQEALQIGQTLHPEMAAVHFGAQMLAQYWGEGRLAELEPVIRDFVRRYPRSAWRAGLASMYCEIGREAEARAEFEVVATRDFTDLPRDGNWIYTMSDLAATCAFLGDRRRAVPLYELLLPYARRGIVAGGAVVSMGCVSTMLGLLAATLEQQPEAQRHFEDAIEYNSRIGAKPFLAWTLQQYATMLATCGADADRARALGLLDQALDITTNLGMRQLGEQVSALHRRIAAPVSATRAPRMTEAGSEAVEREPSARQAALRRDGKCWTLAFGGSTVRLQDTTGLRYLAELLRRPEEKVHVAELLTATDVGGLRDAVASRVRLSDAGPMLDATAKSAYRRRLQELHEDLDQAKERGDVERALGAEQEIEFLSRELARALGLGGRDRRAGSEIERARIKVTKAIKAAIKRIQGAHPSVGHHLAAAVRTGTLCAYIPDPTHPLRWEL